MERRKASHEQLNMLLNFLEEDKELAVGKFTGLEGRIRQTNAWIKITERLNANSGFGSGAIKTPDKWQQVCAVIYMMCQIIKYFSNFSFTNAMLIFFARLGGIGSQM